MRRHVEDVLAARAKGIAVPFAVVRLDDETVIGATRFHQLDITAAEWPAVRQHLADLAVRYAAGADRRQAAGQHPQ